MSNDPVLTATDLTLRFGTLKALDAVTLAVASGERVALLGHNGAGKSTFFRTILGFLAPDTGAVCVAGHAPGSDAARRAVTYLPESVAFHRSLTGLEVMHYFARLRGEATSIALPLMERVGIAEAAKRAVGTYSKGMRQRLGLAQALIGAPQLLLLDEPTSGLDPVSRRDFYRIVDEVASRGSAVLLSSHGLEEVEDRTDRVAILSRGKLVADGTLAELAAEAALKVSIRVTASDGSADRLRERIGGARYNGASVVLTCPVDQKFALVRRLASDDMVRDLDVLMPGLDDIYRHYSDLATKEERP
jgi:Cu-processing system ATP-binding protein